MWVDRSEDARFSDRVTLILKADEEDEDEQKRYRSISRSNDKSSFLFCSQVGLQYLVTFTNILNVYKILQQIMYMFVLFIKI